MAPSNRCRGGRASTLRNPGIATIDGRRGPERQEGRALPLVAGGVPLAPSAGSAGLLEHAHLSQKPGLGCLGAPLAGCSPAQAASFLTVEWGVRHPIPEFLHLQNEDNNGTVTLKNTTVKLFNQQKWVNSGRTDSNLGHAIGKSGEKKKRIPFL